MILLIVGQYQDQVFLTFPILRTSLQRHKVPPPAPGTPMMTNSTPALVIIPVPIVNRSPGSLKFVLLVPGSLLICLTFDFKNCITSYSPGVLLILKQPSIQLL